MRDYLKWVNQYSTKLHEPERISDELRVLKKCSPSLPLFFFPQHIAHFSHTPWCWYHGYWVSDKIEKSSGLRAGVRGTVYRRFHRWWREPKWIFCTVLLHSGGYWKSLRTFGNYRVQMVGIWSTGREEGKQWGTEDEREREKSKKREAAQETRSELEAQLRKTNLPLSPRKDWLMTHTGDCPLPFPQASVDKGSFKRRQMKDEEKGSTDKIKTERRQKNQVMKRRERRAAGDEGKNWIKEESYLSGKGSKWQILVVWPCSSWL